MMKSHDYPKEGNKPAQLRKAHGKATKGIRTGKSGSMSYSSGSYSGGKMKKGHKMKMDY